MGEREIEVFTLAFVPFVASTLVVAALTAAVARWRSRLARCEATVALINIAAPDVVR